MPVRSLMSWYGRTEVTIQSNLIISNWSAYLRNLSTQLPCVYNACFSDLHQPLCRSGPVVFEPWVRFLVLVFSLELVVEEELGLLVCLELLHILR